MENIFTEEGLKRPPIIYTNLQQYSNEYNKAKLNLIKKSCSKDAKANKKNDESANNIILDNTHLSLANEKLITNKKEIKDNKEKEKEKEKEKSSNKRGSLNTILNSNAYINFTNLISNKAERNILSNNTNTNTNANTNTNTNNNVNNANNNNRITTTSSTNVSSYSSSNFLRDSNTQNHNHNTLLSFYSTSSSNKNAVTITTSSDAPTNKQDIYIAFKKPPLIFSLITKYLDENIDNYIHHNLTTLEYDEQDVYVFIFKTNLYITKFVDDNNDNLPTESPLLYKITYLQIFHKELEVNEDSEDYNSIVIQFHENEMTKKSEIKLNFKYKKDSYYIYHFISKYYTLNWQVFYEDLLLHDNPTQYYNNHFQIKKLNTKGKMQDRLLVVSNKFIFNILLEAKKENIKIDEVKWSDSILAITSIKLVLNNPCELKVFYNEKTNKEENKREKMKKIKSKSEREFIFLNKKNKEIFLFLIRNNYLKLTGNHLTVDSNYWLLIDSVY